MTGLKGVPCDHPPGCGSPSVKSYGSRVNVRTIFRCKDHVLMPGSLVWVELSEEEAIEALAEDVMLS